MPALLQAIYTGGAGAPEDYLSVNEQLEHMSA